MMAKSLLLLKLFVVVVGLWLLIAAQISYGQVVPLQDSRSSQRFSRQSVLSNTQSASHAASLVESSKESAKATPAPRQSNLITRTSDAIYRALLGYFSHDDELERLDSKIDESSINKTATTRLPQTTSKPALNNATRLPRSNNTSILSTAPSTSSSRGRTNETATIQPAVSSSSAPGSKALKRSDAESKRQKPLNSQPSPSNSSTTPTTITTSLSEAPTKSLSTTTLAPTSTTILRTHNQPTLQPHLDLTSFRDEPHSTTTQSSTKSYKNPNERKKVSTTTTRLPTSRETTLITTGTEITSTDYDSTNTTSPTGSKPIGRLNVDDGRLINAQENSLEYFSFLNRTFNSLYAINELTYLNRTTRLVHENENIETGASTVGLLPVASTSDKWFAGEREGEPDESPSILFNSNDSNKQAQKLQQQVTSRDDIMLLCKLLHKQLENGSIISANGTFFSSNGTNLLGSSAGNSQKQQRTTSTSTTPKPRDLLREFLASGLHIGDLQNDLNDTHDDHLFESVFSLEKRAANELSYEEASQRFLEEIFNAGFRRKFAQQLNISTSPDQANNDDSNSPTRSEQRIAPIRLKSWSRTITGGKGGRLKLTYWLLMPASESFPPKLKVLDSNEANDLLEELDHAFIKQAINDVLLVRPLVLMTPFRRSLGSDELPSSTPNDELMPTSPSPNVLDDDLTANEPKSKPTPKASGLKDFIDRLFNAPLAENIQIYLIALIILLFIIVMCFAIPMICCKSCSLFGRRSESSAALTASSTAGRFTGNAAPGENNQASFNQQQHERPAKHNGRRARARNGAQRGTKHAVGKNELSNLNENGKKSVSSISGVLRLPAYVGRKRSEEESLRDYDDFDLGRTSGTINEAVWTKLSNSTTTLTKDRTRLMCDDGQLDIPIVRQRQSDEHQLLARDGSEEERLKRFEWYTFEDKTTTRRQLNDDDNGRRDKQSQTLTDHMKMTKSVQTTDDNGRVMRPSDESLLNMSFSDRIETRNSDTLTKSELVMLKEKLIPIGRQQLARTPPPDSQGPGEPDNDELRELPPRTSHDYVNQPTRHIDSSIDDSTNGMSKSLVKPVKITGPLSSAAGSSGQEDQRTPKMRFLELPSKTQSKMEAIKNELGKLEARESANSASRQQPASTYKRYDVI